MVNWAVFSQKSLYAIISPEVKTSHFLGANSDVHRPETLNFLFNRNNSTLLKWNQQTLRLLIVSVSENRTFIYIYIYGKKKSGYSSQDSKILPFSKEISKVYSATTAYQGVPDVTKVLCICSSLSPYKELRCMAHHGASL